MTMPRMKNKTHNSFKFSLLSMTSLNLVNMMAKPPKSSKSYLCFQLSKLMLKCLWIIIVLLPVQVPDIPPFVGGKSPNGHRTAHLFFGGDEVTSFDFLVHS